MTEPVDGEGIIDIYTFALNEHLKAMYKHVHTSTGVEGAQAALRFLEMFDKAEQVFGIKLPHPFDRADGTRMTTGEMLKALGISKATSV